MLHIHLSEYVFYILSNSCLYLGMHPLLHVQLNDHVVTELKCIIHGIVFEPNVCISWYVKL